MKLVFSLIATVLWMMIGCDDVDSSQSAHIANSKINEDIAPIPKQVETPKAEVIHADSSATPQPLPTHTPEGTPEEPTDAPQNPAETAPTDDTNTEQLDERVRVEAERLGEDPNTYRMYVRTESDGSKVYRMIGTYVIINPNGEESLLPDEI